MKTVLLAAAALISFSAIPAFADEGDAPALLSNASGYGMTSKTADGGDYTITNEPRHQTADGGDYVVTNRQD
jgi:hypothetical protein